MIDILADEMAGIDENMQRLYSLVTRHKNMDEEKAWRMQLPAHTMPGAWLVTGSTYTDHDTSPLSLHCLDVGTVLIAPASWMEM